MTDDLKARLDALHVWPQAVADAYAALAEYVRPFKERAEKAEALIAECDEYLKADETPRQRMDRDHADVLSLMDMLAKDRTRRDTAEAELTRLRNGLNAMANELSWGKKTRDISNRIFALLEGDKP